MAWALYFYFSEKRSFTRPAYFGQELSGKLCIWFWPVKNWNSEFLISLSPSTFSLMSVCYLLPFFPYCHSYALFIIPLNYHSLIFWYFVLYPIYLPVSFLPFFMPSLPFSSHSHFLVFSSINPFRSTKSGSVMSCSQRLRLPSAWHSTKVIRTNLSQRSFGQILCAYNVHHSSTSTSIKILYLKLAIVNS